MADREIDTAKKKTRSVNEFSFQDQIIFISFHIIHHNSNSY